MTYFGAKDYWRILPEERNCPLVNCREAEVSKGIQEKVVRLNKRFPHLEWMAYITGREDIELRQIVALDIVVPRQKVTSVSVEPLEFPFIPNVVGTIHSHHTMGSWFSPQDRDHLTNNHPITIVVSGDRYTLTTKETAPCGHCVNMDNSRLVLSDYTTPKSVSVWKKLLWWSKEEPKEADEFELEMDKISIKESEPCLPSSTLTIPTTQPGSPHTKVEKESWLERILTRWLEGY